MAHELKEIPWQDLSSSNVGQAWYDEQTHTCCVRFKGGGLYTYSGVPLETYYSFIHAESIGGYLHDVIKTFPYTRWESEEAILKSLAA